MYYDTRDNLMFGWIRCEHYEYGNKYVSNRN